MHHIRVPAQASLPILFPFKLWHERSGYLKGVFRQHQVGDRGRMTVSIANGTKDLGTAQLPPAEFE